MREITYTILYTILYSKIGILFSLCCPNTSETIQESCMCNVGPGRTYILSSEKRLFQMCLVTCFFKRLQYHRTILALFVQCWLGSSFKACGTTRKKIQWNIPNIASLLLFMHDVKERMLIE